jgi:hypothetical protein
MRRFALLALSPLAALLALVVAVQLAASRANGAAPEVDLDMRITMPGGESRPLRDVLAAVEPWPSSSTAVGAATPGHPAAPRLGGSVLEEASGGPPDGAAVGAPEPASLCDLAEQRYRAGDRAQAGALYASVPPEDPGYARAQRRLGWEFQTKLDRDPLAGVASINRSLRANPLDGNAWQDASRVNLEGLAALFR